MITILIGYMGSGKSAIGRKISKRMNVNIIDLDDCIEEGENMTIPEIFEAKGEVYFRKKESEYLKELIESKQDQIISLGGGTPCYGDNMKLILKATPNVFYLKASIDTLLKRLVKGKENRPLIKNISDEELPEFIGKHLFERNYYYMQSHKIINVDDFTRKEVAVKIIQILND